MWLFQASADPAAAQVSAILVVRQLMKQQLQHPSMPHFLNCTSAAAAAVAAGDLDDTSDWSDLLRPRGGDGMGDDGSGF
jgi:hypothetical protein